MIPRATFSAVIALTLLCALATPALGFGGGTSVSVATEGYVDVGDPPVDEGLSGPTAHPMLVSMPCSDALRGFMGRNTIRPSVRRAAMRRCGSDRIATDAWAHSPGH